MLKMTVRPQCKEETALHGGFLRKRYRPKSLSQHPSRQCIPVYLFSDVLPGFQNHKTIVEIPCPMPRRAKASVRQKCTVKAAYLFKRKTVVKRCMVGTLV